MIILAVVMLLLAASPRDASALDTIRVAVADRMAAVEVRGADIAISEVGCPRCPYSTRRADVVRAVWSAGAVEIDGQRGAGFRLASDRPLRMNGREYSAALELVPNGGGMTVINELPLEDYVVGVLRAEVSDKWPAETLRAQAIVARTYAAYMRSITAGKLYNIVASSANQNFAGRVAGTSVLWDAVRETTGQILLWEGALFPAFYHTESGGYTEDPRAVFAAKNLPALRAIRDEYAAGSPHFYWNLDLRLADLSEILRRNGVDVGAVTAIEVSERTASLRATFLTVRGSKSSVRLRGNDFRRMVGYDTFKSTLFAVAVDGDAAHFSGRGYGHGVGMCQWGAKTMAELGRTARQILEYYYPGTTFGFLQGPATAGAAAITPLRPASIR